MIFTDDDLKWLKRNVDGITIELLSQRMLALIARLEAAEKAMQFMWISEHPIDDTAKEAYEEWRKVAGK